MKNALNELGGDDDDDNQPPDEPINRNDRNGNHSNDECNPALRPLYITTVAKFKQGGG